MKYLPPAAAPRMKPHTASAPAAEHPSALHRPCLTIGVPAPEDTTGPVTTTLRFVPRPGTGARPSRARRTRRYDRLGI